MIKLKKNKVLNYQKHSFCSTPIPGFQAWKATRTFNLGCSGYLVKSKWTNQTLERTSGSTQDWLLEISLSIKMLTEPTFEESCQDRHLNVLLPFRSHAKHSNLKDSIKPNAQNYNAWKRETRHGDRKKSRMAKLYYFWGVEIFSWKYSSNNVSLKSNLCKSI